MNKIVLTIAALASFALASNADARAHYSGSSHSYSQGGHYAGGSGSSHRGGHYVNRSTGNHYGCHKCR